MIYRYIYKITCTAGSFKDKFYFGQHTTENLDDGYKGSGRKILNYYKKHPNDYIKEIISFYNSEEELNQAEYDIIHPWLCNEMCLNIADGGHGGNTRINMSKKEIDAYNKKLSNSLKGKAKPPRTPEHREHHSNAMKGHASWNKGKQWSEESRKKLSESRKGQVSGNKGKESFRKGKTLSEEHKRRISEGLKGHIVSDETRNKMSISKKLYYNKNMMINL